MVSNRADSVGLESTTIWMYWTPCCSPRFMRFYEPGLDAGGQVVAAAALRVKSCRPDQISLVLTGDIGNTLFRGHSLQFGQMAWSSFLQCVVGGMPPVTP